MANWAFTSYAIEGPVEVLRKIYSAILHPQIREGSSPGWEGNVCITLGATWKEGHTSEGGKYLRGFINGEPWFNENGTLRFDTEEAWGVTDFDEVLQDKFPDIKVYWVTEEPNMEVYRTNDKEAKYFKDRYYIDTCVDGNYQSEYFTNEKSALKWLSKITKGKVKSLKDRKSTRLNSSHII